MKLLQLLLGMVLLSLSLAEERIGKNKLRNEIMTENEERILQEITESPTESPIESPTESPTTSPTPQPTPLTPSPVDDSQRDVPYEMIFGILGFSLLFIVAVFLVASRFMRSRPRSGVAPEDGNGPIVGQGTNHGGNFRWSRGMSLRSQRESMSTVFSRDRYSTMSGHYSGKFEAALGKDDALAGYMREQRHEKNTKRKKRAKPNPNANTQSARRATMVSTVTKAGTSMKQTATNLENTSLREIGPGDSVEDVVPSDNEVDTST